MKKKLLYFFAAFGITAAVAQTPGGVGGTNLTMWLKTDNGLAASGGNVLQWQDLAGGAVTGNFGVNQYQLSFPTQTSPTTQQAAINFNTYVGFNGTTNSLSSNNVFGASQLINGTDNTFFQVIRYKGGNVWFKWENDDGRAGTDRLGFEIVSTSVRMDFPDAIGGSNAISTTSIVNKHEILTGVTQVDTSWLRLNGRQDVAFKISGTVPFSDEGKLRRLTLGNNWTFNYPAQIDMAEIICFNTKLSAVDIHKVESYLAIKYGFTLDQTAPQDYNASSGTVTWDAAANGLFKKDIIGIGRDDNATLYQKQSRNNSLLDPLILSLGNVMIDNAANASTLPTDLSFLTSAHNGLALTFNVPNTPVGLTQRLARVWKAQNTNFNSQVKISYLTAMLPAGTPTASIRLLIDDDGDFSNATVVNNGVVNNGRLEFAGQNFDNFSKMYYTLALCASETPTLTSNSAICAGQNLVLGSTSTFTSGVYAWNGPNTFTSSASGFTVNAAPVSSSGIYTLNLTVNTCPMPTATISVTVNPIPDANAGATQTITCTNTIVTLNGSSTTAGVTYTWAGPGTFTASAQTPTTATAGVYTLTVMGPGGCPNTSTTAVVVSQNVSAGFNANPTSGVAPVNVNFSNTGTGSSYEWFFGDGNTSSTTNPAHTYGTPGTYTVMQVAHDGVCTDTAYTTIIVIDITPPSMTVVIPNVFTPNGDGTNDVFLVNAINVKEMSLSVFNRWGLKMHETSGSTASWDGKAGGGGEASEGTYFYVLKATGLDGESKEWKGTVNLFR